MRATLVCTILMLGASEATAQEIASEMALPSLTACQSTNGEGEYLGCIEGLSAKADELTGEALRKLEDNADEFSGDDAVAYRAAVVRLGQSATDTQASWCDVETFESRSGTGFGSIHAACLFEEKLAFLKKIDAFNTMP